MLIFILIRMIFPILAMMFLFEDLLLMLRS